MQRLFKYRNVLVALCAAVIVSCFFTPWIKVHMTPAAAMKSLVGGNNSASMLTVTGAGIPKMANGEFSKIFIKVFGMFFSSVDNADKKSYLVWVIPVLAFVILLATVRLKGKWPASAILGGISAIAGAGAIVKILMTDLNGLLICVQICLPLWVTLLSFIAIGAVHLLCIRTERRMAQENFQH